MKILVVFTGGTIGSTKTDGVISPDKSNSYLLLDLYGKIDSSTDFVSVQPYTILSENLSGENLCLLYDCIIANNFEKYDGVIITHGTDTLQYTSAFLSYVFGLCKIPIVLVSANYPLADKHSNGIDNFRAAVDFIRAELGKGVFVAYKNIGENTKIHRASRIIAHNAYDDKIQSIFDEFYGEISNNVFKENTLYSEKEDEIKISLPQQLGEISDVLKISPYVAMRYPSLTSETKAVLLEGYHSGTLNTSGRALNEFCKNADKLNIPVFLTGACKGFYYESKKLFDKLKINVLPPASPISMYIKLWLLDANKISKVFLSCGGDFLHKN